MHVTCLLLSLQGSGIQAYRKDNWAVLSASSASIEADDVA